MHPEGMVSGPGRGLGGEVSPAEEERKGSVWASAAPRMLGASRALQEGLLGLSVKWPLVPWSPTPSPMFMSLWLAGGEEESGGRILASRKITLFCFLQRGCCIGSGTGGFTSTLRTGQIKMWQSYSSFKLFRKETKSKLVLGRWVLGRDGHRKQRGDGAPDGVEGHCGPVGGPYGGERCVLGVGVEGSGL